MSNNNYLCRPASLNAGNLLSGIVNSRISGYLYHMKQMRFLMIPVFLFTILTLLPGQTAGAGGGVRLEPLPFWTAASKWKDKLNADEIMEASLAASGISPEESVVYRDRLTGIRRLLAGEPFSGIPEEDLYARGDALLVWMHRNLLKKYEFSQTRLDTLLDTGVYNCVSSSVLYLILARDLGIPAEGVETADHSFCRVITPDGPVDVETTTIYGFDPGIKREFTNGFNQTGFTYVPPGNYRLRKNITDKQTVALILQNRMAALQRQNRQEEVVGLAVDRWVFLRNDETRRDVLSALQNLAAEMNRHRQYSEAFEMTARASEMLGLQDDTRTLLYQLGSNQLSILLKAGQFGEARAFLTRAKPLLTEENHTILMNRIVEFELSEQIRTGDPETNLLKVDEAWKEGVLSVTQWRQWSVYLIQKQAVDLSENSGWWAAYRLLRDLPAPWNTFRELQSMRQQMHQNWTAEQHNLFVDAARAKNADAARTILEDALILDPENSNLRADLLSLEKLFP